VGRETDWVVSKLKYRFGRSRPFQRAADLNPCLGRIGGTSYPSGHAALSRMYALVLSNLAPERRKEFMARADEAALYRVIGGVHYPSDIAAGKKTADILYRRFLTSPVFLKDLETMRALIKKPAAVQPRVRDGKRRNL
jgi:acid phosphatase (class A)